MKSAPPSQKTHKYYLAVKKQWWLSIPLLFLFIFITIPTHANTLELQRKDYLAAKKAFESKKYKTFGRIANTLKDYPLYPYLRYNYLKKRIWKEKNSDIIYFLNRYSDLPVTNRLRNSWLKVLIRRKHWQTFLDNYIKHSNPVMQCYQLYARMKLDKKEFLLEDIRSVWLTGKSLPSQCDQPFELLYKSNLVTNELVWKRFRLSMQNNEVGLATYLSRRLNPEYKVLARKWLQIHKKPYKNTRKPNLIDNETTREIIAHGILRLAKRNPEKAFKRLEALKIKYSFTPGEIAEIERILAINAAKKKSKIASVLLDQIDNYHVDDEVFHYRLRTALLKKDWKLLKKWTMGKAPISAIDLRWTYWHARALEETGEIEKAKQIYTKLAKERDYYGFLAADKINKPYSMNHYPVTDDKEELKRISSLPAMKRAYEFYQLDMNTNARREWHHALNKMTTYQMQMAAALAVKWGWHNRAIITMSRAKALDNLVLRFPILFEALLTKHAKKNNIDRSWVFGVVRAESAFIEDISSPVGALGLMQVMPRTGRSVAKHIGIKNFKKSKLREAETNVPIGSAYMKMMLDKFDGNIILATAAYNAGPHRVLKWLPKKVCAENPDIWVELIPFNETRKYVRRVLYFSIVYDWRFKMTIKPMKDRMPLITPKSKKLITKLSCNPIELLDKKNVEEEKIVKTAIHNETTTEYTVKKGDSLWLIARKFDIWVTDLLKWNNLKRNRPLQPGQILKINTEKNVN